MSMMIKGMEMPKNCGECRFGFDGKCFATQPFTRFVIGRDTDCPLEEVPAERIGRWITDRDPTEAGVYLVTILNREWVGKEIIQGAKPVRDDYWDLHSHLYGQLSDGRWVQLTTRCWHDGIWTGYQENVLAWMPMPKPYKGE